MHSRHCRTCRIDQPISEFTKDKYNKDGLNARCRSCLSKEWAKNPRRKKTGRKPYVSPTEKWCNGCQQILAVEEFGMKTNSRPISRCKKCVSKANKEWRERNPLASRLSNLRSKYGITGHQYMEMLEKQGGACICGAEDSGWVTSPFLHVDHNHRTGEIRGLLCHPCNIAVGLIEKGVPFTTLVDYLNRVV